MKKLLIVDDEEWIVEGLKLQLPWEKYGIVLTELAHNGKEALKVYDNKFWNEEEGISCDTWNTEFTVLDDYRGVNANMHTVEAFLAAADVLGEEKYRVRAGRIIDRVAG